MKVVFLDDVTPRSDKISGPPTNITIGNVYEVFGVEGDKYVLLNDKRKMARYSKIRFKAIDSSPIRHLVSVFNEVVFPMQEEIRELKKKLQETEQ